MTTELRKKTCASAKCSSPTGVLSQEQLDQALEAASARPAPRSARCLVAEGVISQRRAGPHAGASASACRVARSGTA